MGSLRNKIADGLYVLGIAGTLYFGGGTCTTYDSSINHLIKQDYKNAERLRKQFHNYSGGLMLSIIAGAAGWLIKKPEKDEEIDKEK